MPFLTLKILRPVDALIIAFIFILTAAYAAMGGAPSTVASLFAANVVITLGIFALEAAAAAGNRFLRIVRDFYPVPMIFIVFKEVHIVIQTLHRADLDPVFIAIDRWIFGTDPTVWFHQFASPGLTELLQVSYTSYYFIMVAMGVEIYRRDRHGLFAFVMFTIVWGFFLSYAGYILFPGVGPRFTLHDFATLDLELPGLWVTEALRTAINAGESIPHGAADPLALAQRDVFPSGHTEMTLITIFFAWKYSIRSRYVITAFGTLLIVSTVYLRYHYVIDLVGGAAFAALALSTSPALVRWWERIRDGETERNSR
jgi:membrane-associated phospholipid phosphatase